MGHSELRTLKKFNIIQTVGKRTEKTIIVALKADHVHVVQAQVLLAPRLEMTAKQEVNNNDVKKKIIFS